MRHVGIRSNFPIAFIRPPSDMTVSILHMNEEDLNNLLQQLQNSLRVPDQDLIKYSLILKVVQIF
jgi:hypothetical protein